MAEPRYWREIPRRYRLEAQKCTRCSKVFFPPRLICSACKSREFSDIALSDEGEIITYTIIHVPPTQFSKESPYAMGIVRLKDDVCITAQIADCNFEDLKIGGKVRVVFRKIREEGEEGIKCYGYKCVLM